jgi:site-specific DNA recombinase
VERPTVLRPDGEIIEVKKTTAKPTTAPRLRVAIYTRQSVATDLEFGSIQAQREAVEAYIAGQRGNGWVALAERYDDHGFSGGNIERPAYQRLVADVDAGLIDVIAVYKIDRISRSLGDFTAFMAQLERSNIGFVSTTQSFDTRTSMGRLTLNILASFSQFEREVISERTKDKIVATRRKGLWTGGRPVLGYDVVDGALVINPREAEQVRAIFRTYLDLGGLVSTTAELARRGIRNKSWSNQNGVAVVGSEFDKGGLRRLLTNPLYIGRLRAGDEIVDGQHEAIVDNAVFDEVARTLRQHQRPSRVRPTKWNALLGGILRCGRCGAALAHTTKLKNGRTHRYYACTTLQRRGADACPGSRAPAHEIEDVVLRRIHAVGTDSSVLMATLSGAQRARQERLPELQGELRRVAEDRALATAQRSTLLDAIQTGSAPAETVGGRIAELDIRIATLAARAQTVQDEVTGIENTRIDETLVREALSHFDAVWEALDGDERQRVMRLLVREVAFDAVAGEVRIVFHENGITALAREATERRSA